MELWPLIYSVYYLYQVLHQLGRWTTVTEGLKQGLDTVPRYCSLGLHKDFSTWNIEAGTAEE